MKYLTILWTLTLLAVESVYTSLVNIHFEGCVNKANWNIVQYDNIDVLLLKRNKIIIGASFDSCITLVPDCNLPSGSIFQLEVYTRLHNENSGLKVIMYPENGLPLSHTFKRSDIFNQDQLIPEWLTLTFPVPNDTKRIELHGFTENDEILLIDSIQLILNDVSYQDNQFTTDNLLTLFAYNIVNAGIYNENLVSSDKIIYDSQSDANSEFNTEIDRVRRSLKNWNEDGNTDTEFILYDPIKYDLIANQPTIYTDTFIESPYDDLNENSIVSSTSTETTSSEISNSETTTSDPTASETTTSEPTASETTTSEPTASETTTSEPTASETTTSEPTASETTSSETTTSDPTASETTSSETTTSDPTASETTSSETTTSDPTASETTSSETTTSDPTASETTSSETTTSETTTSETTDSETTTSEPTASETTTSETTTTQATTIGENPDSTEDTSILVIILIIVSVVIVLALLGVCAYFLGKRKAKVEQRPLEEDFDPEAEPPITITIPRVKGVYYNTGSISPSRYI
ncbi:uncharacterized protein LOC113510738 [Galleria mellonella]|uniref:Uncharacterized protein LOC113510738 n=1 Tax=Galleria mellonella TaxID=7137 RepID=A0A6J1WA39_GALME|nr:uncharacterized protein LOC113510738 [Galleria mellonella]